MAQQRPTYLNDVAIARAIEDKGALLFEQGKTTAHPVLQEQLKENRTYNAPPPAPFTLTQGAEDLYDKVDDGVLIIGRLYLCGKCDRLHANNASGFVISEDGLALTNYHVMEHDPSDENTKTFVAMTRDGRVFPIVEVLAANKNDDTALIRLGGEGFTPVPVARRAHVGQRVHAVTNPAGRFFYYASGEVARFHLMHRSRRQTARRVTITANYAKGSSGGPIFNDQGQVVAMVTTTNSVYAGRSEEKPGSLQMVFRDCVPFESMLELFKPEPDAR